MSSDNVIIKHFKIYIMKKFCFLLAAAAVVAACQKPSDGVEPVDDNTLSYGGVTYKTVTLSNGQTWMAEPLRYVPEGKTVSDDPAAAAGIWYPYEVSSGVAKALKDEASVAKYGYLYDAASAFGVKEVTPANFKTFEGTRGICPEGWHIPTRADFVKLCGFSLKAEGESAPLVDETALFYDADLKGASVVDFNEGNWNFIPTGYMNRTATDKTGSYPAAPLTTDETCSIPEFVGKPTMTYFIGSTAYQHRLTSTGENIQFFDMYGMFVKTFPAGKITVGYGNYLSGYSVRCIKDAQ